MFGNLTRDVIGFNCTVRTRDVITVAYSCTILIGDAKSDAGNTFKLVCNYHPWDPKFVAVVDRWSLLMGRFKSGVSNSNWSEGHILEIKCFAGHNIQEKPSKSVKFDHI